MTEENKSVKKFPNLRFPEFEGTWEVKKLGEIAEIKTGSKDTQNKVDNGMYPFFVRSNTIEKINTYSYDGEAILTSGDGVGVGKNFHYINGKFDFHQRVYSIRNFKKGYDGKYIYNIFSEKFYDRVIRLSAKNSVDSVRMNMISEMKISFPMLNEQLKIASFLTMIGYRIQTQKKIIEGLITQKNFIIKKLFKQNLSDLNTICLSDFLTIPDKIKPNIIDKEKLLTVKLHLKGVHKNENSDSLSLGATNYFIRKKGQFIYGKQNLFNGAFAIIPDKYDGFLSSADVPALDINEDIVNAKYLFYFFSRESFYKKLEDIASGSGSKRIHENTLLNLKITIPSLAIQNKVAIFLSKLDEKINLENELLTQYTNQKKYLLQNLFV